MNGKKPAFPLVENVKIFGHFEAESEYENQQHPGLTKREYFAGRALQGICANSTAVSNFERIVEASVKLADRLLERLEQ